MFFNRGIEYTEFEVGGELLTELSLSWLAEQLIEIKTYYKIRKTILMNVSRYNEYGNFIL